MLDKGNIANEFANHPRLAEDRSLMGEWKCSKFVCCDTWLQFWLRLISLLLYTSNLLGAASSSAPAITTSLFCNVTPGKSKEISLVYYCWRLIDISKRDWMFKFVIFRERIVIGDCWKVFVAGA